MGIGRNLTIVFTFFYLAVVIYLLLFFLVPDFQIAIIKGRQDIANLTEGPNYIWALILAFVICLIGSASIGFPVPFPFVLFSLSNSIYLKYRNFGLTMEEILMTAPFWFEIMGIAIAGGLGCALGELSGFIMGKGAKKFTENKAFRTFENVKGFGKLILDHPNRMYFYIFLAAALPIPDDPLWIALGMVEKNKFNFSKCLIAGWLGKNITTIFYVLLPILLLLGFSALGINSESDDIQSVVTESIMLLVTLTMMYIIFAFD
ncbi:MAG: hypothetical protein ACFFAH_05080, partial [Promethearchaeota archaeon]